MSRSILIDSTSKSNLDPYYQLHFYSSLDSTLTAPEILLHGAEYASYIKYQMPIVILRWNLSI